MNEAIKMQVSAFVDGELPDNEADLLVRRLSQDAQLRQQVAEFLAIGRVMRGEHAWIAVDELRARIAAQLEETPLADDEIVATRGVRSGMVRPLTGVAIAASVALVAIFGLRQTIGINGEVAEEPVVVEADPSETVPAMTEEERQYRLLHGEAWAELGANSFKTRRASALMRVEELDAGELDTDDADEDDDDALDDEQADTVDSRP